jgi:hypothetical protein
VNSEVKAKWVAALRSGQYEQGKSVLRSGDRYCCLGVLCDISGLGTWVPVSAAETGEHGTYRYQFADKHSGSIGLLPFDVLSWAGLDNDAAAVDDMPDHMQPVTMNDIGRTFEEIADSIEAHL